jgi:glycogen synthase
VPTKIPLGRLAPPESMSFRVLHVLDHSWPVLDGYSQRSRSIVSSQLQMGMQPSVLTSPLHQSDDPEATDIVLDKIPYLRTRFSGAIMDQAIRRRWPVLRELSVMRLLRRRILQMLENDKFDIVHAHSPALCGQAAGQAARSRGIPFVYEIRSFWEDSDLDVNTKISKRMRYTVSRSLESRVVTRSDATVGISQSMLEELEGRKIDPAKLFHIPNGVDVERFVPRPPDSQLARELALGEIPTLGFVGTLFPWEGVAWLIKAAVALRHAGTRFKLLIVGDGSEGSAVKQAIHNCSAEDYVCFIGRVSNELVERYYSVIDVLVYPRHRARITELVTPLKPLEAMAQGKAVLGSAVGGIRELIEAGETGVLFEPGNIEDFCRKASSLLHQPDLRRRLGERARKKVINEKQWKFLVRRYEDVYNAASRNVHAHHHPFNSH